MAHDSRQQILYDVILVTSWAHETLLKIAVAFHSPVMSSQADFCITQQAPLTPSLSCLTPRLFRLVFNRNADDLHFHINEENEVYAHLKGISVGWKILILMTLKKNKMADS